MFLKLFLGFTLIPVVELYLLIKIGAVFGALNTLLLVILTGAAGAYLARLQGLQTMLAVREKLQRGETPAEEMLDAMLIFAAGIVLLTPGLLTDLAGLMFLIPATRLRIKRWVRHQLDQWMQQHQDVTIRRYP